MLGTPRVDRLICWGAGLPADVEPDVFAGAPFGITFVVGRRDPIVPADAVARELERVREAGVTFDVVEFDGGHEIDALVLDTLAG